MAAHGEGAVITPALQTPGQRLREAQAFPQVMRLGAATPEPGSGQPMPPTKVPGPSGRSPGKDTAAGSRSCRSSRAPAETGVSQMTTSAPGGRASSPGKCVKRPPPTGWPHPLLRQASFPGNTFPILTRSKQPCNHLGAPSRRGRVLRPASARGSRAVGAGSASTGVLGAILS